MVENLKHISDWLKSYNQKYDIRYVVMYHAADINALILDEGLLAGNGKRKNFGMSESGYVYLAVTPKMAEMFGSMAYNDNFTVYEVIVPVGKLLPDKNRLKKAWKTQSPKWKMPKLRLRSHPPMKKK